MPVTLDFSKAQPIGNVSLDFSKAQPIASGAANAPSQDGFLSSFTKATGVGALAHPIDTLMGLPSALKQQAVQSVRGAKQAYTDYQREGLSQHVKEEAAGAIPVLGPAMTAAKAQTDAGNNTGALGTLLGTAAGFALPDAIGEVGGAALKAGVRVAPKAADLLSGVGKTSESLSNRLNNETFGSYKKDFNRGANPGRGYNNANVGPSLTMSSAFNKVDQATENAGKTIGQGIKNSTAQNTLVPFGKVYDALATPLKESLDAENAPGGMGNTDAFTRYAENFKPLLQQAHANGGLTPSEIFDLKKQIGAKAKWNNTTPEGILDIRQRQVGALGGLLTEAIPELAQHNQLYQDLVGLRDRLAWRAESGAMPLRARIAEGGKAVGSVMAGLSGGVGEGAGTYLALQALDSTAARTTAATGLYKGGRMLQDFADNLRQGPATANSPIPQQVIAPGQSVAGGVKGVNGWAARGGGNLTQAGVPQAVVQGLASSSSGKRLLLNASGVKLGSRAMAALAAQALATKKDSNDAN